MSGYEDVRALMESLRAPDDERTVEEMFAAKYGRRLMDLTPERAMEVMWLADRTAVGASPLSAHGRYNRALVTRKRERVVMRHAGDWLAAMERREVKQ